MSERFPMTNFLCVVLALCTAGSTAYAQQAAEAGPNPDAELPVDPAVTVGTLENGLRYYVRENPEPRDRAELRLVVYAGSILEDEDQRGLAHVVEHMAFNGTEHFEKQELVDYLEGIGMRFGPDLNAYTSFDETVYILKVPTDSADVLRTGFQILEDWARHQTFDPEEVEKERGVVIEEWRSGRDAQARMRDEQFPILFQGSRYADRLPIGTKEVLESYGRSELVRFYRDWYRPDLMAVVAVGDFDADSIIGLVHEHFAGLEPAREQPPERPVYPVPGHEQTLFAIATDEEATSSSASLLWKHPARTVATVAHYRRSIVESLYNRMLNQRLFELTQLADPPFLGASSGQGRFIGPSEFYFLGAGVAEGGIERGLAALLTEAERVDRHGFTAGELDRARREQLRGMRQLLDEREKTNSEVFAAEYVRAFLWDEPIPGIEREYELHEALLPEITLDDVNGLAREWITESDRVVLVNAPEKPDLHTPTRDELLAIFDSVEAAEVPPYEDMVSDAPLVERPPPPAEIVARETLDEIGVTRWELANGVEVYLKPTDFKDDQILVRAWSPGGTSLAADSEYVAAATAAAVVGQGGVGDFSLVELQKALADQALTLSPYIGTLWEGFTGEVSPADVETLFQLIYLYFTAPRRDSAAYTSLKSRIQASLENRAADPMAAFRDTLSVTLTGHHFRARPPTPELYAEMDLEESLEFYRERFADASDFGFVIVGAFEPHSIEPLVRSYLGGLPDTDRRESWRDIGIDPPDRVIEKEVHKGIEARSQTAIVFAGPFEYTRTNRHLVTSLADLLRIRLRDVLREDLGGTYGVSVSSSSSEYPDPEYSLRISFGSAPERVDELVAEVFTQIDSLKAAGPTDQELAKVKEIQRRELETDLRENGFWASQLMAYLRHGMDPTLIPGYDAVIEALTGAMLQEAAATYLPKDDYVRVSLYPEGG